MYDYPLGLIQTFNDNVAYFNKFVSFCENIYDIKKFEYTDDNIDYYQNIFCSKVSNFILLAIYSNDVDYKCIFLTWEFDGKKLVWDIPSGGLPEKKEEIRKTIEKIVKKYLPNVNLNTISPISSVSMKYLHGTKEIVHKGLVFACSISNIKEYSKNNPHLRGLFVPINDTQNINITSSFNEDIIRFSLKKIEKMKQGSNTSTNEIETQKKYRGRYIFHDIFFKKLITFIGYLYKPRKSISKKRYKELLFDNIPSGINYILDIAAGDDASTIKYTEKSEVVVLNDISGTALDILARNSKTSKNIFFTNEDILNANFKHNSFDVVICKNCIHHFNSAKELTQLFDNMVKWSNKRIIVSEIMHPNEVSGLWPKIKNLYYERFLHDVGSSLFTINNFENAIKHFFINSQFSVRQETYLTVMGINYLVIIDKI
ncbi:MAG: class I SAM-dependent methyltransferase [Clostridia bacterium]|nr:class I SAM-dependent methyltransferase [Clostridia bacterium]